MDFFDVVSQRCSVRQFSSKALAKADIEKVVDAARLAPTARNVQPWEFVVVSEPEKIVRLAGITDHGKFLKDAACAVVVVSTDTKYYLEDGSAATANILLAATALGIGSCWIAGDKKPYAGAILETLGIPQKYKLISIIALGYPVQQNHPKEKRPLAELLHWGNF